MSEQKIIAIQPGQQIIAGAAIKEIIRDRVTVDRIIAAIAKAEACIFHRIKARLASGNLIGLIAQGHLGQADRHHLPRRQRRSAMLRQRIDIHRMGQGMLMPRLQ